MPTRCFAVRPFFVVFFVLLRFLRFQYRTNNHGKVWHGVRGLGVRQGLRRTLLRRSQAVVPLLGRGHQLHHQGRGRKGRGRRPSPPSPSHLYVCERGKFLLPCSDSRPNLDSGNSCVRCGALRCDAIQQELCCCFFAGADHRSIFGLKLALIYPRSSGVFFAFSRAFIVFYCR